MLKKPSIITLLKHKDEIRHSAQRYMKTTGAPTHASSNRLHPDKYEIAKVEFQNMRQLGIRALREAHPHPHYTWFSKPDTEAWRPCTDFWNINAKTFPDSYRIPHIHDFSMSL